MSAPLPPPVQQVAVVVPARNEQQLLPGCLAALTVAAERVAVPVSVVVVLDRCTDGTADLLAGRPGVRSVESVAGCVGAARATGAAQALADSGALPGRTWLACTDADSQVPPSWLVHQLDLADRGPISSSARSTCFPMTRTSSATTVSAATSADGGRRTGGCLAPAAGTRTSTARTSGSGAAPTSRPVGSSPWGPTRTGSWRGPWRSCRVPASSRPRPTRC